VGGWLRRALFLALVRAFSRGGGPWSARVFAQQYHFPWRLLDDPLEPLREAGLVVETATMPDHYVPGRDPATITPWHILQALQHHGDQAVTGMITLHDPLTMQLMTQVEEAQQQTAGARNIPQWLAGKDATHKDERSPS